MKLISKILPYGKLSYDSVESTERMMEKIFYTNPYLPVLPKLSADDSILSRTLHGFGFKYKNNRIVVAKGNWVEKLDIIYKNSDSKDLSSYLADVPYAEKYYETIKLTHPPETVVMLIGPFSLSQMIKSVEVEQIITDKFFRQIIVQAITVKALAYVKKIKELSPKTVPIIMFDEFLLNTFGTLKREDEKITKSVVTTLFSAVFRRIQQAGALVGVQSFEKCDWSLALDSGANIISFDAYNNPNNIGIIPEKIDAFIAKGGYINWAVVPVNSEEQIKQMNTDEMYRKFINIVESIAEQGINRDNLLKRATVSIQGDLDKISVFYTEKVLLHTFQLAKKISVSTMETNPQ